MILTVVGAAKAAKKGIMITIGDWIKTASQFYDDFTESKLGAFVASIVLAIIVYFIGKKIVKLIQKLVKKALEKSSIEESVTKFLCSLLSILLNIMLVVIIVGILGVPTSSFIAILGSAGLAIGLALQGSLSNFAGGVLILVLKPFKVNDYIVSCDIEGKVTAIDIFYTKLITPDNKKVVIPNGTLANSSIKNVPDEAQRRLDLIVPVDYAADIKHVREVLNSIAKKDTRINLNKGVDVLVDTLADSSINIAFRIWVDTTDYFAVKADMLENIIERFRIENINIPFNHLDVNITQN